MLGSPETVAELPEDCVGDFLVGRILEDGVLYALLCSER